MLTPAPQLAATLLLTRAARFWLAATLLLTRAARFWLAATAAAAAGSSTQPRRRWLSGTGAAEDGYSHVGCLFSSSLNVVNSICW